MKSMNGIYHVEPDPDDYIIVDKRIGHMSIRSVIQLASGSTGREFARMCQAGLTTVNEHGKEITGKELYEEFCQYCRE